MVATVTQVTEGEILPGGVDESDQAAKFEEFRASAADEGGQLVTTVYLSPTNADGTTQTRGLLQHMFACPIDQYDRNQIVDKVRHEFMGPTDTLWYIRIQVRKTGQRGLLLNQLVPVRKQLQTTTQDSNTPAGADSTIARMLAQMQTQTQAMIAALADKITAQPTINPMQIFMEGQKQAGETFEKIVAAMGGKPAGAAAESGGLDATLKQLMVMRQIQDFLGTGGAAIAGGGASGSDIAEIIKAVTPLAGPGLSFLATWLQTKKAELEKNKPKQLTAPATQVTNAAPTDHNNPSAAPAAKAEPAPATAPTNPAVKEPKADAMKEESMLYAMRDQLGQLADAIALNPDPAVVGGQIMENLPEAYDESLFTLLSSETWFDRMVAVQNKLAPYREWMTKLRDYILSQFTEDDAESEEAKPTV